MATTHRLKYIGVSIHNDNVKGLKLHCSYHNYCMNLLILQTMVNEKKNIAACLHIAWLCLMLMFSKWFGYWFDVFRKPFEHLKLLFLLKVIKNRPLLL